jgi:hypothetical protein
MQNMRGRPAFRKRQRQASNLREKEKREAESMLLLIPCSTGFYHAPVAGCI